MPEPLRIAHVINSLATGGAETLVVDLANEMRTAGHQVTIFTIGRSAGVPLASAYRLGIPVVALGASPYDPRAALRLRKHLSGMDIGHVHLFPSLYFAPIGSRRLPLVYTEHSTWNRRRSSPAFRLADRFFYKRYRAIVAISEGVRETLSCYLARIHVIRDIPVVANGISERFFALRRARALEGPPRLVAVGNLDARKNFADAIKAVARIPYVSLTIVGEGPERETLSSLIRSLDLGDRVTLAGLSDDVAGILDQHDALISTSRFEGFSLVAAEAMAMGLPVIGPNVEGFRDSVIDGVSGVLFDQNEGIEGICRAVSAVTTNVARYAELSEGAARNAERFRASESARKYLDIYAGLRH